MEKIPSSHWRPKNLQRMRLGVEDKLILGAIARHLKDAVLVRYQQVLFDALLGALTGAWIR